MEQEPQNTSTPPLAEVTVVGSSPKNQTKKQNERASTESPKVVKATPKPEQLKELGTATEGSVNERLNDMEERQVDIAIKLERIASLVEAQAQPPTVEGEQPQNVTPSSSGGNGGAPPNETPIPPELVEEIQKAKAMYEQQGLPTEQVPTAQQAATPAAPPNPMANMAMQMLFKEMTGSGGSGLDTSALLNKMMINQIDLGQQSLKEDISLTKAIKKRILGIGVDDVLKKGTLLADHPTTEESEEI